jgi:outer membrane protein OmpA-like peptidoglycan-associated protein
MNKKGSALLLISLLVALPGCWDKDKTKKKAPQKQKMTKKMAQGDEFSDVSMPLADADDMADDSLKSFFDSMDEEFVAFNDETGEDKRWRDAEDNELETVYFAFGKHNVDDEQKEKVELNAEQAKKMLADAQDDDPDAKLIIEGHACASAGSAAYNLALSEKRAKEVADRLASSGISRDDLKVVGRGYEMLVVKEGSRDEQWANRRVELHVVHA